MTNPLPPGPELDRLIAEKVMGWEMSGGVWWSKDRNTVEANPCWSPSTSIADAWEVFEKMVALDGRKPSDAWTGVAKMWVYPDGGARKFMWCVIYGSHYDASCEGPLADTAPHAICLAALATTGGAG